MHATCLCPCSCGVAVGGWAGALLIGPLLIGPWLTPLAGYVPVSRTILPFVSLWLETPDCASADVPQANRHNIANVKLYFMSSLAIQTPTIVQNAGKCTPQRRSN